VIYPLGLAEAVSREGTSSNDDAIAKAAALDARLDALMGEVRLGYLVAREGGWGSATEWGEVLSLGASDSFCLKLNFISELNSVLYCRGSRGFPQPPARCVCPRMRARMRGALLRLRAVPCLALHACGHLQGLSMHACSSCAAACLPGPAARGHAAHAQMMGCHLCACATSSRMVMVKGLSFAEATPAPPLSTALP
jgi:hypothetical protein